jgi:hypothetical protein
MKKRIYHRFPLDNLDFTQKYHFWDDLPFIVQSLAGMNNKTGSFEMKNSNNQTLKAKRNIAVDIAESNVDFKQLTPNNLSSILKDIEYNGILDFKIRLLYSYLGNNLNKIPTKGDTFLVRSDLNGGILTLQVHKTDGPGHTTCGEIADTIIDEICKGHSN